MQTKPGPYVPAGMFLLVPATAVVFAVFTWVAIGPVGFHAVAPPAILLVIGFLLAWPAVREAAKDPTAAGRALILCVMPESSLLFAYVIAFMLAGPGQEPAALWPLWLVGAAAAIAIAIQALLLRAKVAEATTQQGFGRFLVVYTLPAGLTLAAFVVAFAAHTGPA